VLVKLNTSLLPLVFAGSPPVVYVQYIEYLKLANPAVPKVEGKPPDHNAPDSALAGVPARYLIPGFSSNTHDSHTFCLAVTVTGLVNGIVCQPSDALTSVGTVTPSLIPGDPLLSE